MPVSLETICEQANALNDTDKLALIEHLLSQIAHPDPQWRQLWTEEVRHRIKWDEANGMESLPSEVVFAKYLQT